MMRTARVPLIIKRALSYSRNNDNNTTILIRSGDCSSTVEQTTSDNKNNNNETKVVHLIDAADGEKKDPSGPTA